MVSPSSPHRWPSGEKATQGGEPWWINAWGCSQTVPQHTQCAWRLTDLRVKTTGSKALKLRVDPIRFRSWMVVHTGRSQNVLISQYWWTG
eukprot:56427-Alexandrium_andersonii.AAC.1